MKHIVCIIDGTGVSAAKSEQSSRYSNAYNINTFLSSVGNDGCDQVVFYFSGLGSFDSAAPFTESIFANGIDRLVRDAYVNICSNFRIDRDARDKIYIFGFSRGAVVARALSGLISSQGLLTPWRIDNYYRVWDNFLNNNKPPSPALSRYLYSDVDIEFLGIFDCVYGNKNQKTIWKTLVFPDKLLAPRVKFATHLIAIDETRRFFSPLLFDGLGGDGQILEQVWIPGVHTDVGGGYVEDFLSGVSLITMVRQVEKHTDLRFNPSLIKLTIGNAQSNSNIIVNNEITWKWLISPKMMRKTYYSPSSDPCQFIHPVALNIQDAIKYYKGKPLTNYVVGDGFRELPVFDNENLDFWMDIIAQVPGGAKATT